MLSTLFANRAGMILAILAILVPAATRSLAEEAKPNTSRFLQMGYEYGVVMQTDSFLKGDNLAGEPIDRFQSLRFEMGWQTDGSRDWHHSYNFPSYGLGIYGADMFSPDEMGYPIAFYGFFNWPLHRSGRWQFNFELKYGYSGNWKYYDPVTNPKNSTIGSPMAVQPEAGVTAQFRMTRHWSVVGGLLITHTSNGGTQLPNHGMNQVAPILYARYDLDEPIKPPARRVISEYPRNWDLTVLGAAGRRSVKLEFDNPAYVDTSMTNEYFVGNLMLGLGKWFTYKSRFICGLDLEYNESMQDLIRVDAFNKGQTADPTAWDNLDLGVYAGWEIFANRTSFQIQMAYKILYHEVEDGPPAFYQRLGLKQFIYKDWFFGMNVRFHEIGAADNLEWNIGYTIGL